jgi:hypothetical protein
MAITLTNGSNIFTGPHIEVFRLRTQLSALKLECHGIKMRRGVSVYTSVKKRYGFKGNREAVYLLFKNHVEHRCNEIMTQHPV